MLGLVILSILFFTFDVTFEDLATAENHFISAFKLLDNHVQSRKGKSELGARLTNVKLAVFGMLRRFTTHPDLPRRHYIELDAVLDEPREQNSRNIMKEIPTIFGKLETASKWWDVVLNYIARETQHWIPSRPELHVGRKPTKYLRDTLPLAREFPSLVAKRASRKMHYAGTFSRSEYP